MEPIIQGSINPSWVMSIVGTIMCILLWRMLRKMEDKLEINTEIINKHESKLQVHDQRISKHDDEFEELVQTRTNLADEIVNKLRMIKGL